MNFILHKNNPKNNKIKLFIIFSVLLCIYGLRGITVGWDNSEYQKVFDYGLENMVNWFEPGYMLLSRAIYVATHNYIFFQFAVGVILIYLTFRFLRDLSADFDFALFLWFTFGVYFNFMNQIRQSLSTAIGITAICLWKRNKLLAVAVAMASMSFHMGGIVYLLFLLLLYIIDEKTQRLKWISISLAGIGIIFLTFSTLLENVLKRLPVASRYIERFSMLGYLDRGHYRFAIFYTGILALSVILYRRCKRSVKVKNIPFILGTVVITFFAYMSIVVNMVQRITNSFVPLVVICLSNMLTDSEISSTNRKVLRCVVCAVMSIYMIYYLTISNNGSGIDGVTPYDFFWVN